jgi:hypothetical protein
MLPLAHLVLSIGIAFGLEFRHPRRFTAIAILGLIGLLPDLDHFLPLYNGASLFHNTLVLGVFPLALIMLASTVEVQRDSGSSFYQRFLICVAVILMSHLLIDMITGSGIYLGFPTSVEAFSIGAAPLMEFSGVGVILVSSDLLWVAMLGLVLAGNVVQKRIYALFEGYSDAPEPGDTVGYWGASSKNAV